MTVYDDDDNAAFDDWDEANWDNLDELQEQIDFINAYADPDARKAAAKAWARELGR